MVLSKVKEIAGFLKIVFVEFSEDKAFKLSAALSYYTIFSLAPFLIIVISFAGFFYGREAAEGVVYQQLNGFVGGDAALQIQEMIKNVHLTGNTMLAGIVSIVALVIGATGIFAEIQDSINGIWKLRSKPKRGILKILLNRLLSFSLILSLGFLLMVSLILDALISGLSNQLTRIFPGRNVQFVNIFDNVLTLIVITILFGVIFKVLPDAKIRWKDIGIGAVVTAVLFMVGKFAISYYISKGNFSNAYGAAGSIVVIMVWIYYSAVILYLGAEFTQVYAMRYGGKISPNDYAVWIKVEKREVEQPEIEKQAGN
ncbi:MAG: YihY/virulence factor BrkB family protein [Chitinophagaceae bacterium]|nr:YihY/virulence factor BrkB family protein [Chitinophagaceae bacterium]